MPFSKNDSTSPQSWKLTAQQSCARGCCWAPGWGGTALPSDLGSCTFMGLSAWLHGQMAMSRPQHSTRASHWQVPLGGRRGFLSHGKAASSHGSGRPGVWGSRPCCTFMEGTAAALGLTCCAVPFTLQTDSLSSGSELL